MISIPSDPLKKHLAGKQFATDANMKQAVTSCLQTLYINFFLCQDANISITEGQTIKCQW
jgi:hypothetical protein